MKTINILVLTLLLATTALSQELVPLKIKLPFPVFKGTPKDATSDFLDPPSGTPRKPYMVPEEVTLLSANAKVTSGDPKASDTALAKITDGEKDAIDDNIVLLRRGPQWVQVDLGTAKTLYAVVIWHAFDSAKIVHGVVVQVSNDPTFATGATTVFNNDRDNKCGQGNGKDLEYFEGYQGKLVGILTIQARYVRCYSYGNTEMGLNQYTEIEVYGKP